MSKLSKFKEYVINNSEKIKISSKDIKKGDIFLALKGSKLHGNNFIDSAINKGAKYCLTDKNEYYLNSKIIVVSNIYNFLKELVIIKRNLYKGKVIGITGSAGKTTLKETLAFFLKKNHSISYSKKSYNNELGIFISILNLNLNASFAIFEIGTNNFGEIKNLTKIVEPSEIFITNIQSTHLENFQTKNNIAREKSDIFLFKNNTKRTKLYLNVENVAEKIIFNKATKEKNLKIIEINKFSKKYFIKNILSKKNNFKILFTINDKLTSIETKTLIKFRLMNLLFCYAFFHQNFLDINIISKYVKYLKPFEGRGLEHLIEINNKKIRFIDESYNANPDTMHQSILYFSRIKKNSNKKILILGNMNELGKHSIKIHTNLLYEIDKYRFKIIILCGEFFRRSVKKLSKPQNEFKYINNKNSIMQFLHKNIHNDDIILIKCSNSTEINLFAKSLLKKVI